MPGFGQSLKGAGHVRASAFFGSNRTSRQTCPAPRRTPVAQTSDVAQGGDTASARISGTLLVCVGAALLLGIITAEALFPGTYGTSHNQISDLGSTWNPGGRIYQPSAAIFNTTMLVTGVMTVASAGFLYRASRRRAVTIALGIFGLGLFLVGIFHGRMINGEVSSQGVHPIVAMVAFISGPLAALLSARLTRGPFRYLALTPSGPPSWTSRERRPRRCSNLASSPSLWGSQSRRPRR